MITSHSDIQLRINALRVRIESMKLDAFIVPSEDAHQSEYIAAHDGRREYITGFTGSAGYALITKDSAYLWTDGRYFLQASKELPSFIKLMRLGVPSTQSINQVMHGMRTGIDAKLVSINEVEKYKDCDLVYMQDNLIDLDWETQPAIPTNPIITHDIQYSGKIVHQKLIEMRASMALLSLNAFVITTLDEIAWLFNLRGNDIPFNPVFFGYAIVFEEKCVLFTNAPITLQIQVHLDLIVVKPYMDIFKDVKNLTGQVGVDPRCNKALYDLISAKVILTKSPILMAKAIKNQVETAGMESCHLRDAAALCNFFGWLKEELKTNTPTECQVADILEGFRSKQAHFMGLSFDTISASGPNGAIIHYKPEPATCSPVTTSHMFLLDSGGQYLDGTTDVTRTHHFGTPTKKEMHHYSLVLKGHIAIDSVEFPRGTTGYILDVLARKAMWKEGLDFKHGTGHGVGVFLNVHEGPHGIGIRIAYNDTPLQEGMIVTNEPGLYFDGEYGIRIENVVKCVTVSEGFLGFKPITFMPMDKNLIEIEFMDNEEIEWINKYHEACFERVGRLLEKGSLGYKYLEEYTGPLSK